MKTNEKIDFLMKIANTANSALGKYLTFDASYISRIRSGKRALPKNQPFIEPASVFFAEQITDEYQKKIAAEVICPGREWPDNARSAQQLILEWFSQAETSSAPVNHIISDISALKNTSLPSFDLPVREDAPAEAVQFFYGNEGKREAVSRFLSELVQMNKPPQLLLYSNEEFDWMYADPAFAKKWAMLLFQYIQKGGRIKIAHTISRASGEMLVALQKWIPVYMTGAIEPYYYPKILDRVFRKTMFIAEGYSAIMASSVGEHTQNALNCLIHDSEAVKSLEQEYWQFFELCKPLMQIFNFAGKEKFHAVLQQFKEEQENTITVRTTPSFCTMPLSVAKSMTERLDSSWILKRREDDEKLFCRLMEQGSSFTEILNLPDPEQVRKGQIPFPMCDLFDKPGLYYTVPEFAEHLRSVIRRMEKYEHYHVVLSAAIPENEIVYVKEEIGVILVKSDVPSIAFVINEMRMVSAFWDYLSEIGENSDNRRKTIAKLEKYLKAIEIE